MPIYSSDIFNTVNADNVPKISSIDMKYSDSKLSTAVSDIRQIINTNSYIRDSKSIGSEKVFKSITTRQIPGASNLYKKCAPGVPLIISLDASSLGSGAIINKSGEIVTNWHVVQGNYKMLVWLFDPKISSVDKLNPDKCFVADVIAADKSKDLALLRILDRVDLSPVTLDYDYNLSVAQDVFAIGHPEAYIWTFTYGVISQLRDSHEWKYDSKNSFKADVIQTQTPTNPGNSGGPLFNEKGRMVGINSFGSEGQGLNFAVKVGEVREFADEVRKGMHTYDFDSEPNLTESNWEWEPLDMDGNGVIDCHRTSINDDGYFDLLDVDKNEDGLTDFYALDTNHDGAVDITIEDLDNDAIFETWVIDENFDGVFDITGEDIDGDWVPDKFSEY